MADANDVRGESIAAARLRLLEASLSATKRLWLDSKLERDEIRQLCDREAAHNSQGKEASATITMRISDLERVYHSIALDTIRRHDFLSREIDELQPKDVSEWIDAWPILDDPVILAWLAKHGHQYPLFLGWVLAVDSIRQTLIKIRTDKAQAKS